MSRLEHGPTVLLGGMTGAVPFHGGATWAVLQYALGLERLGCRVVVAETVPRSAFAPVGTPIADSANARYVAAVMAEAGLAERWVLLLEDSCTTAGMAYDEILRFAAEADLVVNLGGALRHQDLLQRVARRLYVDLDPAFTQLWAQCGIDLGLEHHTHFATYGRGLADERSSVPSDGRRWIGTVPPVVRSQWAPGPGPGVAWTTVANWRSYGSLEHDGVHYGQKAHSWRGLFPLPHLVDEPLTVALAIDPGDASDEEQLRSNGWQLADPARVAATPDAYRRFVRGSRGEIGVAKSGYVASRTGWVSDRSACYLASGRPVVAQDTGLSDHLPVGEGLLCFTEVEEAADALARVRADYGRHRRAALELAGAVFDSDHVLGALLEQAGAVT